MNGPQPTTAQLRPALQFALDSARAGGSGLPGKVRSLVRARRLPPSWASTMRQVLEDDDSYRKAVAGEAPAEELGRLAWLWLARPDGWSDEIAELIRRAAEEDEQEHARLRAEQRVSYLERELSVAAAARDAAIAEADKARQSASEQRRRAKEMSSLASERAAQNQDLQERLAQARDDTASVEHLRTTLAGEQAARSAAEEALRDALTRAERVELEARAAEDRLRIGLVEADRAATELGASIAAAVGRAAEASESLGTAIREVATLLGSVPGTGAGREAVVAPGTRRSSRTTARQSRSPLPLPPAVLADAPEAAAYLVRAPGVHLVVDGYNVTFRSWIGDDLPSLRHRLVSALSELSLRYRLPITVVFDGADAGGLVAPPPAARLLLRIVFSSSDVEADAVIVDTVMGLPPRTPVVVATDDREVRERAGSLGANVLSVEQILGVIGRQAHGRGR